MLPIVAVFCLIIWSSFLSLCSAGNFTCCGNLKGFPPAHVNFTSDTALELNNGWQRFFFGSAGTWAVASNVSSAFYSIYDVPVVVRITDVYENGDRFAIYLNGSFLGNTTSVNRSSLIYTDNPDEAWVSANYSHGEWILPPGLQRLTIKVLNSVNSRGSGAAIQVDVNPDISCGNCRQNCPPVPGMCKCDPRADLTNPPGCCANNPAILPFGPTCVVAGGQLTMIKVPMARDVAALACSKLKLRLAQLTTANFDGINQFAYVCNGNSVANSWIRSWNGDDYENSCLVLTSGAFSGSGAITAQDCNSQNYVICEA